MIRKSLCILTHMQKFNLYRKDMVQSRLLPLSNLLPIIQDPQALSYLDVNILSYNNSFFEEFKIFKSFFIRFHQLINSYININQQTYFKLINYQEYEFRTIQGK
ncbi:hypothetical protein pb186bvf_005666 [Paramecium bursaria]